MTNSMISVPTINATTSTQLADDNKIGVSIHGYARFNCKTNHHLKFTILRINYNIHYTLNSQSFVIKNSMKKTRSYKQIISLKYLCCSPVYQ